MVKVVVGSRRAYEPALESSTIRRNRDDANGLWRIKLAQTSNSFGNPFSVSSFLINEQLGLRRDASLESPKRLHEIAHSRAPGTPNRGGSRG